MVKAEELHVGQTVDWFHGSKHLVVAEILEITELKVKLLGITKSYWVNKSTLLKNLNKADASEYIGIQPW